MFAFQVDNKRESFKTDFGVILPQYGEIHLNNDLKWDRKIKSVDFKSHLFGEEFLQLEGALDGRVLMQTDVFLKIMYETLKVIEGESSAIAEFVQTNMIYLHKTLGTR